MNADYEICKKIFISAVFNCAIFPKDKISHKAKSEDLACNSGNESKDERSCNECFIPTVISYMTSPEDIASHLARNRVLGLKHWN